MSWLQCWIIDVTCNHRSMATGELPSSEKHAIVSARLKKSTLNPAHLNSYRTISNLPSKSLVERCVAARFVRRCDYLFPARQSHSRRHHSTETAMLVVRNYIVQAVDREH